MQSVALRGLTVALILTLLSCANPAESAESLPDFPPLPLFPSGPDRLDAALPARLVLEGRCLYLLSAGGEAWLALWPWPGTSWDGVAVSLDGARVSVGSNAEFRGGEIELDAQVLASYEWVNRPLNDCLISKAWFVYTVTPAP